MITVPADALVELGTAIFTSLGAAREKARFVAETIVEANLTGHDSHGVVAYLTYTERIKGGYIDVEAAPTVVEETATTALVDGRWSFGQLTAMKAMEVAVEKAERSHISAVAAYRCNHIGRVGYYTAWAAERGLVALMFVNVGHPVVTVYGGRGRVLGTNPLSIAIPTGGEPFLLDYATSVVAHGKVRQALLKGRRIPRGWIRDKDGGETDDPAALDAGGWLLPFGGHKGYCLQLVNELLGAALTGSRSGLDPEEEPPSTNGVFIIALDPDAFVGLEAFRERCEAILRGVKRCEAEAGMRVMIPGEPEWETRRRRMRGGVPLPEALWSRLVDLAGELGVDEDLYRPWMRET
ncbi:MAG: malate/lactate dehydrogenase [Candidatus Bathyarchaeota archaeon B23]|nr:MAG: malate/lactate dehydrogenase [Candidatus Bathyarchaeota archaeon B23]